ncbi:MAG: hypothetical protein H0V17_33545, partial [Deltaproteobacteria bacterium]|nr:hypothetical protein [Deltaproteobacteria bacterium]
MHVIVTEDPMITRTTEPAALPRAPRGTIKNFIDRDVPRDRALSQGAPSKPLFNALPLARLIPQDVHSVMD